MNYLLQTIGLLLFSSFVVSCADAVGPEIEKGVKTSAVDGAPVLHLLSDEGRKLRASGHQVELQWSHRKVNDGTYQVLAEMRVLDAPKLSRLFQWKAQKATATEAANHWLVRADNKDTKRLVRRSD